MGHEVTLVVPTRSDRNPHYLDNMIDVVGAHRCVIVHTAEDSPHRAGARNLTDLGPINIHRWWNAGIDAADTDYVAVANDDISINHDTLPALARALEATGATIAHPWHRWHYNPGPHGGGLVNILGCLWMVDKRHGLRPDVRFRWWFGDNDLAIRALNDGNGIVTTNEAWYEHHTPNRRTSSSPGLQRLAVEDRATFTQAYPWFY